MNPITNLGISSSFAPNLTAAQPKVTEQSGGASFKDFLMDSIKEVNSMQQDADQAVERLVTGDQSASPAEVLTAVQKADIAFRMMMQIRNKMVQAYQEVQNIRV